MNKETIMTENESTERKQVFVGNIRKCPNCGAQITTDTAKCPSCGFVIEKEKVSSAMDEFAKKFVSLQTEDEKRELVESYPVPNNKEDLRGFLNYAANQRDKDYPTPANKVFWVDAWNNKCRLIVNQAVDVFGSDAEFMQYLRTYKAEVEKSSSENKKTQRPTSFCKDSKIFCYCRSGTCIGRTYWHNFLYEAKKAGGTDSWLCRAKRKCNYTVRLDKNSFRRKNRYNKHLAKKRILEQRKSLVFGYDSHSRCQIRCKHAGSVA